MRWSNRRHPSWTNRRFDKEPGLFVSPLLRHGKAEVPDLAKAHRHCQGGRRCYAVNRGQRDSSGAPPKRPPCICDPLEQDRNETGSNVLAVSRLLRSLPHPQQKSSPCSAVEGSLQQQEASKILTIPVKKRRLECLAGNGKCMTAKSRPNHTIAQHTFQLHALNRSNSPSCRT